MGDRQLTDHGWTITKDLIDTNAHGTVGPSTATLSHNAIRSHPKRERFRMLDDDGEVYYEGFAVLREEDDGFGPLDDFGAPNAGCTQIDYWESGWKPL
jgi:hypothetical protein